MDRELLHENYTTMLRSHLKKGELRAFNQMHAVARKAIPDFRLDACGIDLRNRDLSGIDLRNADLIGAKLDDTILDKADFTNADLSDASLLRASLKRTVLYYARAENADFSHATLSGADMEGIFAKEAHFCSSLLQGTRLHRAYLIGSDATDADFTRAQMREALFSFVTSKGLILENAQLADADIRGTDLSLARIKGAKMTYALFSTDPDITAAREAGAIIEPDREYTEKELEHFRYTGKWPKSKERYDPLDTEQSTGYSQKEWHDKLTELAEYFAENQSISEPPVIQDGELLYPITGIRIRAAHTAGSDHMRYFDILAKRYPELEQLRATPTLPAFNRWLAEVEDEMNSPEELQHHHGISLFFGSGLIFEPLAADARNPYTQEMIGILAAQCCATLDAFSLDPTKAYEGLTIDQQTGNPVLTGEAFCTVNSNLYSARPRHPRITKERYPSLRELDDPLPPRLGESLENKAGVGAPEPERIR